MVRDELNVRSAFLAVAEDRSFTRAAVGGKNLDWMEHVSHAQYLK